ncbi:hypothetical protein DL93DRAFT_2160894 [Clavulina sp. PMI_390]|nr:hypothetical protein DL93DRAFT_2160894 [Clavulina sp. PMI_390]
MDKSAADDDADINDSDVADSDATVSDNDAVPEISVEMANRLALQEPADLSSIPREEAIHLLDLVNAELRRRSFDDPDILRLLQDLSGHFLAVPSSFIIKNVTFDRKDVIGRGGEATVYRGSYLDETMTRPVVVREVVMPPRDWISPLGRKVTRLVHREAITHSQLDHANIIPFLGIYHEGADSPPITILPLIERGSLQDLLAGPPIDLEMFQRILTGISSGVVYLHSRRPSIIHGDLHPGNVLVDATGNPFLCDFGLSRVRHEVTRTRTLLQEAGRLRFLAPELSGGWGNRFRTSTASDMFSLAMTFLNVWTGQVPFPELRNDAKVAASFRKGRRPKLVATTTSLAPAPTRDLRNLLNDMWAQEPQSRPPSTDISNRLHNIFLYNSSIHVSQQNSSLADSGKTPQPASTFEPRQRTRQPSAASLLDSIAFSDTAPILCGNRSIDAAILHEADYLKDLDSIDSIFIQGLRHNQPPIMTPEDLDTFISTIFGKILDLRKKSRRILEQLYERRRVESSAITPIGDVFLAAAMGLKLVYPDVVGDLLHACQRVQKELEENPRFKAFHDECIAAPEAQRLSLQQLLMRPYEHLKKYPALLEAIQDYTAENNNDSVDLAEAYKLIQNLFIMSRLKAFQVNMLRASFAGEEEWHSLVANDIRESLSEGEVRRQEAIFELIKSEMEYVRDLEAFQTLFIHPLRAACLPLTDLAEHGVDDFLRETFHNYEEILKYQRLLLSAFFKIQSEEYPCIHSIVAPIMDAALNWGGAYIEYATHYPIAEYRIDEAKAIHEFRAIVQTAERNPESNQLSIGFFIDRPVSRLPQYVLLLKRILGETPTSHPDQASIPDVVEILGTLYTALNNAVEAPKKKVQMWNYHHNLVWKPGEEMNLDLLDDTRQLLHTGWLLQKPGSVFTLGGWLELFVLLFDNYLVMAKAKKKDGVMKYYVDRRPIPLELLHLSDFNEVPTARSSKIVRSDVQDGRNTNATAVAHAPGEQGLDDHRLAFPCRMDYFTRVGGRFLFFTETYQARDEWKYKLEEAINNRKVVLENNKAFKFNTLSRDTFIVPIQMASPPAWNDGRFTGKVTCSIPLRITDGRDLFAVGCAEGVWIGFRNDPASLRRVIHLKNVTQCAMLEEFGIFLVLADKNLIAYHIETLVPTGPPGSAPSSEAQRVDKSPDVQFFSVGMISGRTLIIYAKKKGLGSVLRVLEPVTEKIAEKPKSSNFPRSIFASQKSEWFREYKEIFVSSKAYDLIFLKARVAILSAKGFEIMELEGFRSVIIPQRDTPRLAAIARRLESRRPVGIFRSGENEFLLCYDEFGLYVDRHGDAAPGKIGVIEWEGTAEHVAFHPPYVLIFDSQFIEIRDTSNGKLVQIIQGSDVHCTWDGRGYLSRSSIAIYPDTPDVWDEDPMTSQLGIHAAMNEVDNSRRRDSISQHVFELVRVPPKATPQPYMSITSTSNSRSS